MNIRVTPEIRMRLDEIAEATGVTRGGFVRMCVDKVMSMMYDSEGYLMDFSRISDRRKLNELDGFYQTIHDERLGGESRQGKVIQARRVFLREAV